MQWTYEREQRIDGFHIVRPQPCHERSLGVQQTVCDPWMSPAAPSNSAVTTTVAKQQDDVECVSKVE